MNAIKTELEIVNPRLASTLRMMQEFNQPYKTAVAINCSEIGDDNDYSCFLSRCIFKLWKAGEKELALRLANTDPMLHTQWNAEDLENRMKDQERFNKEEEETQKDYYRFYHD